MYYESFKNKNLPDSNDQPVMCLHIIYNLEKNQL